MSDPSNVDYAQWDTLKPDATVQQFALSDFQLLYRSHLAGGVGWCMLASGDVYFMRPFPDPRMYLLRNFEKVLSGSLEDFVATSSEVSNEAHNRLWALRQFPDLPTWMITYASKDDPFTLKQKEIRGLDHSSVLHWASQRIPNATIIAVETGK
jgi:hypothetical protein